MSERLTKLYAFRDENPDDPFLHYAVATELLKLGRVDEALQGFESLTVRYPEYLGTYYHLGKAYESQGRTEDAIRTYEAGMLMARKARQHHTLSELQAAWRLAKGMDEDDDY